MASPSPAPGGGGDALIDVAFFAMSSVVTILLLGCLAVYGLRYARIPHSLVPDTWVMMALGGCCSWTVGLFTRFD